MNPGIFGDLKYYIILKLRTFEQFGWGKYSCFVQSILDESTFIIFSSGAESTGSCTGSEAGTLAAVVFGGDFVVTLAVVAATVVFGLLVVGIAPTIGFGFGRAVVWPEGGGVGLSQGVSQDGF